MKIPYKKNNLFYWINLFYVILILFMPNFIRNRTIIYSIDAKGYIAPDPWNRSNPWLSYSFSILEIFAVLYSFICNKNKKIINLIPVIAIIIVKEIVRFIFGSTCIFQYGEIGDYSMILSLLVGYGCFLILTTKPIKMDIEDILDLIIIINFITQLLFVFTGRQNEYGGRYAALGSAVGAVGQMCFMYLMYFIFVRRSSKRSFFAITSCLLSLILSGSRSNLAFTLLFVILFAYKIRGGLEKNKKKRNAILILVMAASILIPIIINIPSLSIFDKLFNRLESFVSEMFSENRSNYLDSDSSFSGRIMSMKAGFNILIDNPFGVSSSTIDLQIRTQENGYYTFPHSTFLSYYLLWGPAALMIYSFMSKYIKRAIRVRSETIVILVSTAISFLIYGAPTISSKSYFWYIAIFAYCKQEINRLYYNDSGITNSIIESDGTI